MTGHCGHCRDGCEDEPVLDLAGVVWFEHSDEDGRTWLTSDAGIDCSACVERERIVEAVELEIAAACGPGMNEYIDGLTRAAAIARGEA